MSTKLRAWPNGLGFDFRDWELVQLDSGEWSATWRPRTFGAVAAVGTGRTVAEAMQSAEHTQEYTEYRERVAVATRAAITVGHLRALMRASGQHDFVPDARRSAFCQLCGNGQLHSNHPEG
jgi:hypothetical protein